VVALLVPRKLFPQDSVHHAQLPRHPETIVAMVPAGLAIV
jgi:hypothetical protein